MEKQILTALLVLVLVAPQTGLEAKSRHHGVKDRDHDAEERDHEDKKRYHKAKKRHHKSKKHHHSWRKFIRLARATKAELELLKQSIAEMDAKMKALEPQGQLPGDLAEQVDANTSAIGANTSAIGVNTSEITMALDESAANGGEIDGLKMAVAELSARLDALQLEVDDHELRIAALEQSDPPSVSEHVFSSVFSQGVASTDDTRLAWNQFVGNATGEFTSIEIKNSLGGSAICSNPVVSTDIANALKSFVTGSTVVETFNCGVNQEWSVGDCGGVELHAGPTPAVCGCSGATVRPLIANASWGGIGNTCNAQTQTLEVILTR